MNTSSSKTIQQTSASESVVTDGVAELDDDSDWFDLDPDQLADNLQTQIRLGQEEEHDHRFDPSRLSLLFPDDGKMMVNDMLFIWII